MEKVSFVPAMNKQLNKQRDAGSREMERCRTQENGEKQDPDQREIAVGSRLQWNVYCQLEPSAYTGPAANLSDLSIHRQQAT